MENWVALGNLALPEVFLEIGSEWGLWLKVFVSCEGPLPQHIIQMSQANT